MDEIKKEHILSAIKEIDEQGIRPGRNSSTYDLIYEGKTYPPKLVISIANRYATGTELDSSTFAGGIETPAFQLLEKEGFEITNKEEMNVNIIKNFAELIVSFSEYIKSNDSIIANFIIQKHKTKAKYIWISDSSNIIGDSNCHYELIERISKKEEKKKGVSVEIHFEEKNKKIYYEKLKDILPEYVYWNDAHRPSISIAYKDTFSYDDPDLLIKLEGALIYLEENLGDKIRKIKNAKYSIQQMEKMFIKYLDRVIPKSAKNYLSGVSTVEKIGKENLLIQDSIYEIQDSISYDNFFNLLNTKQEYLEKNDKGNSMYSNSLKKYKEFINDLNAPSITESSNNENMSLNQILYGPPRTGKTYNTINKSLELIGEKIEGMSREDIKELYEAKVIEGQIVFTTFHQNMSYEDFIEGIKPITVDNQVIYKIEKGIFRKLCEKASEKKTSKNFDESYSKFVEDVLVKDFIDLETPIQKKPFKVRINGNQTAVATPNTEKATEMGITKEMLKDYIINDVIRDWKPYTTSIGEYFKKEYPVTVENIDYSSKKYVIIIDEINRGNVSKIFGELITLIEESKRTGSAEAITAVLPYSKEEFSVPDNVYILGTMNTADRSVEALDTALRRRFDFVEMMPKYNLIETVNKEKYQVNSYFAFDILQTINKRIEVLLGRDHLIGHSFFLLDENESIEVKVKSAFYKNIIPLLQEYFYGDYNKIGLVLGSGFVTKTKVENPKELFANSKEFNGNDYVGGDSHNYSIAEFKDNVSFYKALDILMNKTNGSDTDE